MPAELVQARNEATAKIGYSASTVEVLLLVNEQYSTGSPEGQISSIDTYQQMSRDGLIQNEVTIKQTQFFIDFELAEDVATLDTEINDTVRRCTANGR